MSGRGFKVTGKVMYDGFQADYYIGNKTNLCTLLSELEGQVVTVTVNVKRRTRKK